MSPCSAPGRRVSPRGEALPRSLGREWAGRLGAPGASGPHREIEPAARPERRLRLAGRAGAEKREGKEQRGEAWTPGQRRLPGNFAEKSRDSEKEKHSPIRRLPTASPTRRANFALGVGCCVQRPPSLREGSRRADACSPRLGRAPRP